MTGPQFKNYGRGGFRFCGGESTSKKFKNLHKVNQSYSSYDFNPIDDGVRDRA